MNNEKLGAAPQMHAGGDAKQAIEFAWPYCFWSIRLLSIVMWQRVSPLLSLLVLSCVIAAVYAQSKFLDTDKLNASTYAQGTPIFLIACECW